MFSFIQCKLYCLQSPSCEAVNYNLTENICSQLTVTCPKAVSRLGMALFLSTGRQPEQCLEWIPIENGDPVGDRSVTEDSERFVARMQKDGNDLVCYLLRQANDCLSSDDSGTIQSKYEGFPCQYLRVSDGWTVMYVDYELDTPLPNMALIGGYTADGRPVYIGLNNDRKLPGPCITNVFATRRKNFSQWYRSFQRKLLSHWVQDIGCWIS